MHFKTVKPSYSFDQKARDVLSGSWSNSLELACETLVAHCDHFNGTYGLAGVPDEKYDGADW
jgi:hypothetical protein